MRSKLPAIALSTFSALVLGTAWAGSETAANTLYGYTAGGSLTSGSQNVIVGALAGPLMTSGFSNVVVGHAAGHNLTDGGQNVFLGLAAGYSATGSNKLYIDNCMYTASTPCDRPFIYGEFDTRLLAVDGVLDVSNKSTGAAKSQLHFSHAGTDVGGWLTSVGDNNFFMSSGARFEGPAGGWIQRSSDGNAVIAGSSGSGYKIFTSTGVGVGGVASSLLTRFHIDYSGQIGLNTYVVPGLAIATGTGAYLSAGGVWTNASSRDLKENIRELSAEDALQALDGLRPVSFTYKATDGEAHVGFIAEDVPQLVATKDRKSLSSMDVVAVLTKVVKEQDRRLEQLQQEVARLSAELRAR